MKGESLCKVCGLDKETKKECAWTSCPKNWDEDRIDIIGQNGNEGLHYEETTVLVDTSNYLGCRSRGS